MFCRLYNIDERMLEELALGLSREFHLNVQWLPGARLNGELVFGIECGSPSGDTS